MRSILLFGVAVIVIFGALYYESYTQNASTESEKVTRKDDETRSSELEEIQSKLRKKIAKRILEQKISEASVYFELLKESKPQAVVINDSSYYSPASMAKVFVMTELLKRTEKDKNLLQMKVSEISKEDKDLLISEMSYPPELHLSGTQSFTLEELNKRMIIYSDNEAYILLVRALELNTFNQLFEDLDMQVKDTLEDYITVSNFSKLFSKLYKAEYLSRENSDYALELLSQTKFTEGLVKGVPSDIKVAHKFGERLNDKGQQLHDCGVIYFPDYPYILCVMTKGNSVTSQAEVIASISKDVYNLIYKNHHVHPAMSDAPTHEIEHKKHLYNGHMRGKKYHESMQVASPSGS